MITYTSYPTLLFSSYTKDTAPSELPFRCGSESDRVFLSQSTCFHNLFPTIATFNSLGGSPKNYWLSNSQFNDVDSNDIFRNFHFAKFLSSKIELKYGVITMRDGGQYMYILLPSNISQKMKGVNAPYFCVALFSNDLFIGIEECFIIGGMDILPTGRYNSGMDKGGYLSFAAIALSFLLDADIQASNNQTSEFIFCKK